MNRFPNTEVLFKDTYGAGGITVRGVQLKSDEEGFIVGPPDLETEIEPHGFIRGDRWFSKQEPAEKVRLAKEYEYFVPMVSKADRDAALKADKAAEKTK